MVIQNLGTKIARSDYSYAELKIGTEEMAQYKVNEFFSSKIQEAILSVCSENYSSQGVEVDGIVCVSFKNPSNNCVVKIHKSIRKEDSFTNILKANELQNFDRNSSNLSRANFYHDSARSNYLNTGNESQNEDQIYYYDDSIDNDAVSEDAHRHQLVEERRIFNNSKRQDKYFVHDRNDDVESHTSNGRFCTESGKNENRYSEDNDRQNYVYGDIYSSSGELSLSEGVKVEQDDHQETYTDWNRPFQQKVISKKSNLETIIERFSSHIIPLTSGTNTEGNETNELQDNYNNEEKDFSMHIENYCESDNDEIENDVNPIVKYSNPVCIDLSESDPDLYQVQSELEAREHSELNRSESNYKSDHRNVEGCHGPNEQDLSPGLKQSVNSLMKTQTEGRSQSHSFLMKNLKSLSQIKRSLHTPFRRPKSNQSLQLSDQSSAERRKVYCKYCGVGFTNSGNKNRHERSTCGAVKYKCEFCDSLFSRSDSRTRHMLYCHGLAIKDRQSNFTLKKHIQKQADLKPNRDTVSQNTTTAILQFDSEIGSQATKNKDNQDLVFNHVDKLLPEVTLESNSHGTPVYVESATEIPES